MKNMAKMFIQGNTILAVIFGLALIINFACAKKQVQMIDYSSQEIIKITEVIMFDLDAYNIRGDQLDLIAGIAETMIANPDIVLVIDGYASEEGETNYNLKLSQNRANAVKSMLMLNQVPEKSIKSAIGKGETNIYGEILDSNRRVMVLSIN